MTTGLLITTAGQAEIAADLAGGADLVLSHVAFGDAGGVPYLPNEAQVALVNERYRATIASVAVVAGAIVIDAIVPADTPDGSARPSHGFNVAEAGIYSAAGTLIGVAQMSNGYKPPPSTGQASIATFRFKLPVANPSAITVVIDPQAQIAVGRQVRPFFMVVDGVLNAPPGAPATGATYVIGAAPTGAWAGFAHRLAQWVGVWALSTVPTGHLVVDNSQAEGAAGRYLRRTAGGWVSAAASDTSMGVVRMATEAEAIAGTEAGAAMSPATMKVAQRAHGQCQLRYVGATEIRLYLEGGDIVRVAGKAVALPAAGVAAANTAVTVNGVAAQNLAANTEYLVALGSAGALEFWTKATGHTRDTTAGNIGVEVIAGHADKTLVGMVATNASSQFANSAAFRGVISWFNRRSIDLLGATTPFSTTSSVGYVELHGPSRIYFLTWADEAVDMKVAGQGYNNTTGFSVSLGVGVDGVFQGISGGSYAGTGGQSSFTSGFSANTLSEGLHYITPMGTVGAGGTGTFSGAAVAVIRG